MFGGHSTLASLLAQCDSSQGGRLASMSAPRPCRPALAQVAVVINASQLLLTDVRRRCRARRPR